MSNKVELRTKMAELQREYSSLNAQVKAMEEAESKAVSVERYKDYLYKVGCYGYKLDDETKVVDVNDDDRASAVTGGSGLVYCDVNHKDAYAYLMLKSKEEYARFKLLFTRLEAAERILDKKEEEKAKYVAVLLGETSDV